MGCKFTSSLVYLWGGGRNFGPHVRTQLKFEYPPGGGGINLRRPKSDLVKKIEIIIFISKK